MSSTIAGGLSYASCSCGCWSCCWSCCRWGGLPLCWAVGWPGGMVEFRRRGAWTFVGPFRWGAIFFWCGLLTLTRSTGNRLEQMKWQWQPLRKCLYSCRDRYPKRGPIFGKLDNNLEKGGSVEMQGGVTSIVQRIGQIGSNWGSSA